MILEEVTATTWQEVIREPWHSFASAQFNKHNADKAEHVHYLLFKDSKYRLGLIAGQIQGTLMSPFSAPFGGYTPVFDDIKIQSIEEAVGLTEEWATKKGLQKIKGMSNNSAYVEENYRVFIEATKDIPANSEILVSYGKEYWDAIRYNIKLDSRK